ncbi:MAG: class I SAM-dependent methyltransferase [Saprospiraceae bacterium]|nr:class I SAM-dependent methyltransferase [Saprospiraceae bacterium]
MTATLNTTTPFPKHLLTGLQYAENNFLDEHARHLHLDKQLLRSRYDLNGKKVLDFGCGMGGMTLWYAKNWDCTVHGVDLDPAHVQVAEFLKEKYGLQNVKFHCQDVLEKPLTDKYDFIVLNDVVEHIPMPVLEKIILQLRGSLAEGGVIFLSFPPWRSPYASHVTSAVGLPWCQFLPQKMLYRMIEKKNSHITGAIESDLLSAYKGLNHLTFNRLENLTSKAGLKTRWRKSHCLLNRVPAFKNVNFRVFPLDFLVTKEFVEMSA